MSKEQHPASAEPPEARLAYARVIAALANADGEVTDDERHDLRKLCHDMALDDDATGTVLTFAEAPDPHTIRSTLRELRLSNLRFTVVTDMVVLGLADGTYSMDERKHVRGIAGVMGVSEDQVISIEQYVISHATMKEETARRMARVEGLHQISEDDLYSPVGEAAAQLAALGVPVSAVFAASAGTSLSFATVQSGLAALGLGLGPVPGVGVAFGLGVGTFFAVRTLYRHAIAHTLIDDDEDE